MGRQTEVVGITLDLTPVFQKCRPHPDDVIRSEVNHEVGFREILPVGGLEQMKPLAGSVGPQGDHFGNLARAADMGGMPVT